MRPPAHPSQVHPVFPPELDLSARIRERAASCGIELVEASVSMLADHARAVLRASSELHLTSITEPEEFLERHIGESFEGAAMLDPGSRGLLFDLGSGNGYPGIPIAAARPGLRLLLAEASARKAAFLESFLERAGLSEARVLERQVQRPADLTGVGPIRVLTSRAMGGWAKILPRLASALAADGELLVWCGQEMETVSRRVAWRRFEAQSRRPLPRREQSWIWGFRASTSAPRLV